MNPELRQDMAETAPGAWERLSEDATAIQECAVIQHFPEEQPANRYREPLRYIGIGVRFKQPELFERGREELHLAACLRTDHGFDTRLRAPTIMREPAQHCSSVAQW